MRPLSLTLSDSLSQLLRLHLIWFKRFARTEAERWHWDMVYSCSSRIMQIALELLLLCCHAPLQRLRAPLEIWFYSLCFHLLVFYFFDFYFDLLQHFKAGATSRRFACRAGVEYKLSATLEAATRERGTGHGAVAVALPQQISSNNKAKRLT